MGGRGAGIGARPHTLEAGNLTASEWQAYTTEIESKFSAWLQSKSIDDFEGISYPIEKMSLSEVKEWLTPGRMYTDDEIPMDDSWYIQYKDGSWVGLSGGDSLKGVKRTNIDVVIYENENTTAVYGKKLKIENITTYDEYKRGYEPSWRVVEK